MELKHQMIFKCPDCGHVIEVIFADSCGCEMQCCGKPMRKMDEKNREGAEEKHLPVIEALDNGIKVKVGSLPHPMDTDHWIQFIEVLTHNGLSMRRDLSPGDLPEALFSISLSKVSRVRELCNLHGLWSV